MKTDNKAQKIRFHQALTKRAVVLFISLFLLSESSAVSAGNYGLKIVQKLERTQQNNTRAEAEKLTQEGVKLFQQGTTESLSEALVKLEQALKIWEYLGDKRWQANTLIVIDTVYANLGEKQKAPLFYNLKLPLFHEVGDRSSGSATLDGFKAIIQQRESSSSDATRAEAKKLSNEGLQLFKQGTAESLTKAREKFQAALVLWEKLGDKSGQGASFVVIGRIYSDLGEKQKALSFYNQALPLARAIGDRRGEAVTLNNIGRIYSDLGEKQKALSFYNQALLLARAADYKGGEATIINGIGQINSALGDKQKALLFFNQALPLRRAVGDRRGEAVTLNNIGRIYLELGEQQKALSFFNKALPLSRAVSDRHTEATILDNIGAVYSDLGEKQKALSFYNQVLSLARAVGDRRGEARTLNNIGAVYSDLGEKQKAISFYNQALPLRRAVDDKNGEATTLNNIGAVYSGLGDKQKAISFYNQALPLARAVGDKGGEATTLNNIGAVYSDLGEKQKALSFYNQALPLLRAVDDKGGEATTLNNIGGVYDALGEKQKALSLYNQSLPLARAVGDRVKEAATINNIGQVYSDLGEKQKALSYFNQALPSLQAVGDRRGEATTLVNIGAVYSDLGEKQKALLYYNQALPLLRAVGDKRVEATTLGNIGQVYSDLGEKQKALSFFNQALPLARAVGDKGGEAKKLNNIGQVYSDLGEKQKALLFFNQALPSLQAVGDRRGEAITLINIGLAYSHLGEKQKALSFFNQALPLAHAVGDRGGKAAILSGIGLVYDDLGEKQKALSFYNQALPLHRAVADKSKEAGTLNNIGGIYLYLGEKQKALSYFNQALSLDRTVGNKGGEATTLNNIGGVYYDLGEKQKALSFYNQALPLLRAVGDRRTEATTLGNLASLERKQGNLQASLKHIQDSIQIIEELRGTYTNQDLKTTYFATVQRYYKFYIDLLMELHKKHPSKGYDALALNVSEKSRARGLLELLTEARADIRKGANPEVLAEESRLQELISAKEKQRFELVNDKNKINNPNFKDIIAKLETEIANLLEEYKQLQVRIKQSNPKYASLKYPEPLKLAEIQQQLDKDSLLLQYSLGDDRSFLWVVSPDSLDTYELPKKSEIDKSAINLFCLISQSSSKPPDATGKENACEDRENIKTRRIDVAAEQLSKLVLAPVKDKLGKKRLIVVADGALQYIPFAALADLSHTNKSEKSQPAGDFESPAGEMLTQNSQSQTGGMLTQNSQSQPSKISTQYSKQNQKDSSCTNTGGISVCENENSPQNKINYQPLLINHEIVNLPSASTIAIQRQQLANRKQAPKALAILADPVFTATDNRVAEAKNKQSNNQNSLELELERSALKRSADIFNRRGWTRLKGTRTEAKTLLQLVPNGDRLNVFDFDANYNWATSNKLNQYRILHFATHGFVNDANPELSGIVLSLVDKQGQDIRGYLRLGDLFNLDYPADLIVLSACETGLGKEIQGEGLVGLTRGLMYAGAERLVVSLWQVSDEGTAEFMQEFYKQMLQQGKTANQALRATQIKMWKKWKAQNKPNPNDWAAFTFLGEWEDK